MWRWTISVLVILWSSRLAEGGHVLSRVARPASMDGASETVKHSASPNVQAFSVALLRLRQSQGKSEGALQTILGYLERIRDHPRDPKARSVCLWEPAFRTHVARTDGGLQSCRQQALMR